MHPSDRQKSGRFVSNARERRQSRAPNRKGRDGRLPSPTCRILCLGWKNPSKTMILNFCARNRAEKKKKERKKCR